VKDLRIMESKEVWIANSGRKKILSVLLIDVGFVRDRGKGDRQSGGGFFVIHEVAPR
jgi:hypothetical protein